jgi:hypothetical protein
MLDRPNGPNRTDVSFHLKTETAPFSEILCLLVNYNSGCCRKCKNPRTLNVIDLHLTLSDSMCIYIGSTVIMKGRVFWVVTTCKLENTMDFGATIDSIFTEGKKGQGRFLKKQMTN